MSDDPNIMESSPGVYREVTPMDRFEEIFRTTPKAERDLWFEDLLMAIVHQMVKDSSHDLKQIRAFVTHAGNPNWRGEPLPLKKRVT